jgi:UDP-N-acetylmuramate dehydrogenase
MIKRNVSLAEHSNYKIGGPADYYAEPETIEEISRIISEWTDSVFVLGGGTNILFPDNGLKGLVLKPNIKKLEREGNLVRAGAGVLISDLLDFVAKESLSGLEWAGGLPGTLGGAIRGNAGAFGGEIKDSIKEVVSLDISGDEPKIINRNNEDCKFSYRNSVFKDLDKTGGGRKEVVVECLISLVSGDREKIKSQAEEKINYRKERHPIEYPNIGSIFKNVDLESAPRELREKVKDVIKTDPFPVIPTAYLLSEAGLKGTVSGGAMISPKHPNFIVNVSNATAKDVKDLIKVAKEKIKKVFNVELEEEVIIL